MFGYLKEELFQALVLSMLSAQIFQRPEVDHLAMCDDGDLVAQLFCHFQHMSGEKDGLL